MIWDAVLFSGRVNLLFAQPDVLVPVAMILMMVMLIACAVPALRAAPWIQHQCCVASDPPV